MKILNKGLLIGLFILAAIACFSSAAILGGIEWAFASLGAFVLIGVIGIGIRASFKALQYSRLSLEVQWSRSDDIISRTADAKPISKEDKRIIMRHINELFSIGREQDEEKLAEARPVSKEDKRIIMRHIDALFNIGQEHSGETERRRSL